MNVMAPNGAVALQSSVNRPPNQLAAKSAGGTKTDREFALCGLSG